MNYIQIKILNWGMKHLFRGISDDDIITFNAERTKAFSRGLELPKERIIKLKEEAESFSNSFFWRDICDKNLRYTAQEMGMARKEGDLPMAQAMIFDLDIIKKAIQDIKDFKIAK